MNWIIQKRRVTIYLIQTRKMCLEYLCVNANCDRFKRIWEPSQSEPKSIWDLFKLDRSKRVWDLAKRVWNIKDLITFLTDSNLLNLMTVICHRHQRTLTTAARETKCIYAHKIILYLLKLYKKLFQSLSNNI